MGRVGVNYGGLRVHDRTAELGQMRGKGNIDLDDTSARGLENAERMLMGRSNLRIESFEEMISRGPDTQALDASTEREEIVEH